MCLLVSVVNRIDTATAMVEKLEVFSTNLCCFLHMPYAVFVSPWPSCPKHWLVSRVYVRARSSSCKPGHDAD